MDFEKDRKEWAKKLAKDRALLAKYRSIYCMTEAEGQEYISHVESMKNFMEMMKETKANQKDPAYKKARKVHGFAQIV